MNGKRKIILIIRGGYMLTFFPVIQDDELLYSVYTRYHERSLNKNENKTIDELHLTEMNPFLPKNIQYLIDELKYFDAPDIEYFLNFHSMCNYISNFISPNISGGLSLYLTKGTGKAEAYVVDKIFSENKYLKYCPVCTQKDFKTLGESFWRLSHQLPTLFICLEHKIPLDRIDIPNHKIGFKTIAMNELNEVSFEPLTKKTMFYVKLFAKQSFYLNRVKLNLYNSIQSQDFYRLFVEKGFVIGSEIDVKKLKKEIVEFYGIEFLELSGYNTALFREISERPLFFSNIMTPIETLVLINFFFNSLSGMLIYNKRTPKREIASSLLVELLV
ncbi:TniQ family protein [Psychrobacillus sp.]|uniref:TniQ family protein n=1 Tax=Psychrobacillus sp. TaxID=1871623 RepID=UPI0028BE5839|nr:TniQ family protein [Psychrobacillus sp.]